MRTVPVQPEHEAFRKDLVDVLRKYEHLPPVELLAMASQMVGQMLALQDQTKYEAEALFRMVMNNVIEGNQKVIEDLLGKTEGSA